jgi:hypothetical protein
VAGRRVRSRPVRLDGRDRRTLAAFGVTVGGWAGWGAWRLIADGEVLIGTAVAGLAIVGALALWSALTGR